MTHADVICTRTNNILELHLYDIIQIQHAGVICIIPQFRNRGDYTNDTRGCYLYEYK